MKIPSFPRVYFLSLRLTGHNCCLFHAALSIQLELVLSLKVYHGKLLLLLCLFVGNRLFPGKWYLLMRIYKGLSQAQCRFVNVISRTRFSSSILGILLLKCLNFDEIGCEAVFHLFRRYYVPNILVPLLRCFSWWGFFFPILLKA